MRAVREGSSIGLVAHLAEYVDRGISPAQFQRWLIENEAIIEDRGDDHELALAWTIENRLYDWQASGLGNDALIEAVTEDAAELGYALPVAQSRS